MAGRKLQWKYEVVSVTSTGAKFGLRVPVGRKYRIYVLGATLLTGTFTFSGIGVRDPDGNVGSLKLTSPSGTSDQVNLYAPLTLESGWSGYCYVDAKTVDGTVNISMLAEDLPDEGW